MNRLSPVFTAEATCQDCYKCIRQCPVKAIRVVDGHAAVMPDLCIACGHCVRVCPVHAKRIRDDVARARHLIATGAPVYASLAPSWVSEFPGVTPERMAATLEALGFAGASETALGAQAVSAEAARRLREQGPGITISSACPAAVAFIARFLPKYRAALTPVASPALAHARMIRQWFGAKASTVFIGPCIAKKLEADHHPDELALALTFEELHRWLAEVNVAPGTVAREGRFVPHAAEEGVIYPVEGGMNATVEAQGAGDGTEFITLAGIRHIDDTLGGYEPCAADRRVFIECLACKGGCVRGPAMTRERMSIDAILRVRRAAATGLTPPKRDIPVPMEMALPAHAPRSVRIDDVRVRAALRRIGKTRPEDEQNCGGCGYDTCRAFARALLEGNAEPAMCVSHMRRIAHRKANALLRCMPSGAVIVNAELRVVECNRSMAHILGPDAETVYDSEPGLAGAYIDRLLPFEDLFRAALRLGQDITRERMPVGDRLLDVAIFTIEPRQTVGAIIQDVTATEMRREQIARRAREVIHKNLATVQEIACRLGEHMADTEILLNSIAQDYGPEPVAVPGAAGPDDMDAAAEV